MMRRSPEPQRQRKDARSRRTASPMALRLSYQDLLPQLLGRCPVAFAFTPAFEDVLPQQAPQSRLQLSQAWQSKLPLGFALGLDIGLVQAQMGQQQTGDQHQVQVAYYTSIPQQLVVAQSHFLLRLFPQHLNRPAFPIGLQHLPGSPA